MHIKEQYLEPPHIAGRRLDQYHDPRSTLEEKGVGVGGYIRISTAKDSQKTSIENQKKLLTEWAEINGYHLTRFYTDVATGKFMHLRGEMQELRSDIRAGRIRGVITKEISRTSRDIMDVLQLKRELFLDGAFFLAIKEGYDSRKDDDEFLLVLYAALAQKELKTTAGRVKLTQIIKAKEGRTNVPDPAYGYTLSADKQHLVPDPETAPVYRVMVEKFLEGWGQARIARYLNARGIPSKRGKAWCTNAVKVILSNPVYLGITIYNTTTRVRTADGRQKLVRRPAGDWILRENTHAPLIDKQTWENVQEIIRHRRERAARNWTCGRKYLASGILRCAVCGGKIFGARFPRKGLRGKGQWLFRYRCMGTRGTCPGKMKYWDMEEVDRLVMGTVQSVLADRDTLMKEIENSIDLLGESGEKRASDRDRLSARLSQVDRAVKKQQAAFEADVINLEEYGERMAQLRNEKEELLSRIHDWDGQLARHETVTQKMEAVFHRVCERIDGLPELGFEEKSAYVNALFEEIYLTPDYRVAKIVFRVY